MTSAEFNTLSTLLTMGLTHTFYTKLHVFCISQCLPASPAAALKAWGTAVLLLLCRPQVGQPPAAWCAWHRSPAQPCRNVHVHVGKGQQMLANMLLGCLGFMLADAVHLQWLFLQLGALGAIRLHSRAVHFNSQQQMLLAIML